MVKVKNFSKKNQKPTTFYMWSNVMKLKIQGEASNVENYNKTMFLLHTMMGLRSAYLNWAAVLITPKKGRKKLLRKNFTITSDERIGDSHEIVCPTKQFSQSFHRM